MHSKQCYRRSLCSFLPHAQSLSSNKYSISPRFRGVILSRPPDTSTTICPERNVECHVACQHRVFASNNSETKYVSLRILQLGCPTAPSCCSPLLVDIRDLSYSYVVRWPFQISNFLMFYKTFRKLRRVL
jgi:hypothetical protein